MPVIGLATAAIGGIQAIAGAAARKKQEKALEGMKNPTYTPNQSILDYYDKALAKYNTSPTDTAAYKQQRQDIEQGTVQGVNQLQDRRSALAGVGNLIQNQNNSLLKASVAGEQQKAQQFATLGNATNMKAGEGAKQFQYNKLAPFEKDYNLLAAKAGASSQRENAGLQNIYQGLTSYAALDQNKKNGGNNNIFAYTRKQPLNNYNYSFDPQYNNSITNGFS